MILLSIPQGPRQMLGGCAVTSNGRTIIGGDRSGRAHFLRLVEADESLKKRETKFLFSPCPVIPLPLKEAIASPLSN